MRGAITDHTYARPLTYDEMIPPHLTDHTYLHPSKDQPIFIDQQYADDVGWIFYITIPDKQITERDITKV